MECIINDYKFILTENNAITVYTKTGLKILTTFNPNCEFKSQKAFEFECSDWYFKNNLK